MPLDRTTLRVAPKIERRPAVVKTVQRSASANAKSPGSTLQERLGNRATQLLISRSIASANGSAATRPIVSTAQQTAALNANAFTVGEHIFFGRDKFQPESNSGRQLIAHELTHTIQQGAAIQRDAISVHEHVAPQVQGDFLGIPNPREYFASK